MKTDRHDLPALLQHAARTSTPTSARKFEVVHHTDFLLGLVAEKKLVPEEAGRGQGRLPRLAATSAATTTCTSRRARSCKRIPGVELVEAEYWNKSKGLCCGAGGAQMWMEEQNKDRVNVKRTLQLLDTGAKTIASACPFCMTMLTDGLKAHKKEEEIGTSTSSSCWRMPAVGEPSRPTQGTPNSVAAAE